MASPFDEFNDALTVGGYRLGSLIARLTPGPVAQGAVSLLAPGIALSLRQRRLIIERHLKRVDPSLSGLALRRASQQAFDSYMRYYTESFRLPTLSRKHVLRTFSYDGYQHILTGLEKGKGVIVALPHLGGWEWAGRWMSEMGHRMTVIVEPLEPPELFDWFVKLRSDLGMNVVPLGPSAGSAVLAALARNEIVCLLSDRDIQGNGVEVEFFGERTTLPAGPAMLGIRSGAVVVPTAVYFTKSVDGHHCVVRPPLSLERTGGLRESVAAGTQALAHELEGLIRRAPEQWHLFQPNWPSDPGYAEMRKASNAE
jgi:KDO2-lipid IV(A) lauroyltransferase